jgi:hypothetical protein
MLPARCSSAVCCVISAARDPAPQQATKIANGMTWRAAGGICGKQEALWPLGCANQPPLGTRNSRLPEQKTRHVLCVLHFAFCDARWRAWCLPWSCPNGQRQIAGALGAARFLWLTFGLRRWPATPAPPARCACAVVCTPLSSAPHTTKDSKCAVVHLQVVWGVTKAC